MTTLPCIVCDRPLESANGDDPRWAHINQPSKGTTFSSSGQYGSTIWDPMDGSYIMLNICDACLRAKTGSIIVGRSSRPVILDYCGSIGYQEIDHETKPWDPAEGRPFEDDCYLSIEDLDNLPDDIHLRQG